MKTTELKKLLKTLPSHHNPMRGYIGWDPFGDYLGFNQPGWTKTMEFPSVSAFLTDAQDWDIDLNLIADFYFADSGDGDLMLNLWLLHPRKGASRGVEVRGVKADDLPAIKALLRQHMEAHTRHFAWAMK